MDSSVLLSVVGGVFLLSIILVSSLCIHCWRNKQPTSIPQRSSDPSAEYPPFVVRHPQSTYVPHQDHHRIIPCQLPNSLSSPSFTQVKIPSCPPSETGSQASYVNDEQYHQPQDEQNNYITVIPDSPNTQHQNPSRASSHSSGENYINIEKEDAIVPGCDVCVTNDDSDSDSVNYENVMKITEIGNQTPALSYGSLNSDDRGSSDYVNTDPHLL